MFFEIKKMAYSWPKKHECLLPGPGMWVADRRRKMIELLKKLFLKRIESIEKRKKGDIVMNVKFIFLYSFVSFLLPRIKFLSTFPWTKDQRPIVNAFATLSGNEEIHIYFFQGGPPRLRKYISSDGDWGFYIGKESLYWLYSEFEPVFEEYGPVQQIFFDWNPELAELVGEVFQLSSLKLDQGDAYLELKKKIER